MAVSALLILWGGDGHAQAVANPYSYTRASAFTYYTAADGALNGLIKSETVEPGAGDAQLCVVTTYTYDARGNKSAATTANCPGASGQALFASRTSRGDYGTASRTQTITTGAGTTSPSTRTVTQAAGLFQITATNALDQPEKREFDSRFGAVIRLEGPNGPALATRWEVDDFGRRVKEIRADGTMTLHWHCVVGAGLDTSGNTVHVVGGTSLGCPSAGGGDQPAAAATLVQSIPYTAAGAQAGPLARVYADRLGREIRSITEAFDGAGQAPGRSAALVASDVEYNAYGAKIIQTQPYFLASNSSTVGGSGDRGLARTDYDALGRPTAVYQVDPNGSQPSVSFGGFGSFRAAHQQIAYTGLSSTHTNDKGQTRTEEKDINGQLMRTTDASLAQLAHQYDAFGNLIRTKDALQNVIEIKFDKRGRKLSLKDPDAGLTTYDYNALGELVWQQNARQAATGTATTSTYDLLGRLVKRIEPEYTSNWSYDKYFADAPGSSSCNKGVGKLCESSTTHGAGRKLAYDNLGRPITSTMTLGSAIAGASTTIVSAVTYDANTGRVDTQTYPTGVRVGYAYTPRGFLEKLVLHTSAVITPLPATPGGAGGSTATLNTGSVLWQAMEVNAWGRAEKQWLANGINARAGFQAATGRLSSLGAGAGASSAVQDMGYTWDNLGNLAARIDRIGDGLTGAVSETFDYLDSLNRLTRYQVSAANIAGTTRGVDLHYNALGMLLYKSDVGNYAYPAQGGGAVRPHALQGLTTAQGTTSYQYDENGNLKLATSGKYRSLTYTSFNLPASSDGISGPDPGGLPKYGWHYDDSHARIVETQLSAAGTRRTIYLHPDKHGGLGFERETSATGAISNRHYLSAGGQAIGVLVTTGALQSTALTSVFAVKLEFWHKDHLGSIVATTDHTGSITARYAYDPFGKRRHADGRYDEFGTLVVDWRADINHGTDRGYTGHEHLDDVGLVHMNGRIFDPALGIFVQPDPFIQAMGELQNFNRYGYCFNNPGSCTDPSGEFFFLIAMAASASGWWIAAAVVADYILAKEVPQLRPFIGMAYAYALGPGAGYVAFGSNAVVQTAVAGFVGGAVSTGTAKGGMQGMFSAVLFYSVGQNVPSGLGETGSVENVGQFMGAVAAHGVAGCVSSVVGGGKCGPGALSAAFSKAATPLTAGQQDGFGRALTHAVIGGTAAELGGGKFSNGAMTGAFGYLFNFLAHERRVRYFNPNTGETEVVKRYVVSFSMSDENNPTLGMVEEYANKGLRGVAKGVFRLVDFIAPDGYGTPDLNGVSAKWEAYKMDAPLKQLFSDMKLSTDLGGITAAEMRGFLNAAGAKIPNFTPTYGTTDQILKRIEQKYDGSWKK